MQKRKSKKKSKKAKQRRREKANQKRRQTTQKRNKTNQQRRKQKTKTKKKSPKAKKAKQKADKKVIKEDTTKIAKKISKKITKKTSPGLGEQMIKAEKRSDLDVDLAAQAHRHKTKYREGSGTDVESAHMVNSSSVRDLPNYKRDSALTVLLPKKQHKAFDDYWKKWARKRKANAKPGEDVRVTVAEWEKILNDAADSVPELSGRTADTMSFMIRTELYQTLGLKPDQLLRLPGPK